MTKGVNYPSSITIDFRAIKEVVTMQSVIEDYGIEGLRRIGRNLRGRCPIHKGNRMDSFCVSLERNLFNCFSCQARGDVLAFVAAIERCSIREAATKLQERFSISSRSARPVQRPTAKAEPKELHPNQPLTFALRDIDIHHAYLSSRGISADTAETFGVGLYAGKGTMTGRIVIPIHNNHGQLVAYAGRSIDAGEPRYKLPRGFHSSLELFNLHRVTAQEVVIVEGFFDCMKVWQALFPFVVALMGCNMSLHQQQVIESRFKRVTLMMDGDDAGRRAADRIASRLAHRHVRIVSIPDGKQPDELSTSQIGNLLA